MRILIAEDDCISRCMLAAVLKMAGHEPVETVNGLEAWEALQKPNMTKWGHSYYFSMQRVIKTILKSYSYLFH